VAITIEDNSLKYLLAGGAFAVFIYLAWKVYNTRFNVPASAAAPATGIPPPTMQTSTPPPSGNVIIPPGSSVIVQPGPGQGSTDLVPNTPLMFDPTTGQTIPAGSSALGPSGYFIQPIGSSPAYLF
jgi:hypothetical protein